MKCRKFKPKRYQLTKQATSVVVKGHPWVFRSHLSSAASVFDAGQWLRLVSAGNEVVGYGVIESTGAIAIRVLRAGKEYPGVEYWKSVIRRAAQRREHLRKYTNGFRLLHGEGDNAPGIVIDVYDSVAVLQTYSPSVDSLGRFLGWLAMRELSLECLVWKMPSKRRDRKRPSLRVLFGNPPDAVRVQEGKLSIWAPIMVGQKSGTFLDLRNLRKWLASRKDLTGKRVLNLYSYTGTLGLACESAGCREIWNVDIARAGLDFGKKFHALGSATIRFIEADIFDWFKSLSTSQRFDLIIIDPPQMASDSAQVKKALYIYRMLCKTAMEHLNPLGRIAVACCTSRVQRPVFEELVSHVFSSRMKLEANLKNEDDHPVTFKEGDYLKVLVYRERSGARR